MIMADGAVRLPSRLFRCETIETLEFNRVIVLEVPLGLAFDPSRSYAFCL